MVTTTIDLLETLRLVLPLALLALIVAILALAHRRRRALGLIGIAMVVAGIVSLVIAWLGSGIVGRAPDDPVAALIAKGAYDAFVEVLVLQSLLLIAIGAFIALVTRLLATRRPSTPTPAERPPSATMDGTPAAGPPSSAAPGGGTGAA
jgi:hypothetical protein